MTKKKRWLIPLIFVLAGVLLLGLVWDSAKVYLFPKAALTEALANTSEELSIRFRGSPIHVLSRGFDMSLNNRVHLDMTRQEALLGPVHYDMTLQTQLSPRRILAQGTASTEDRVLDLGLYLDDEFAAITSEGLLAGGYYGITYETFSRDIRKSPMLAFLIGEDTISQWETDVESLRETMGKTLELPEISREDIKMAMMGLLALRPEVTKETVDLSRGPRECFRLRFQVEGELIRKAAEMANMSLPVALEADDVLTADFYLAEDYAVCCDLQLHGSQSIQLSLTGDTAPLTDELQLKFAKKPVVENTDYLRFYLNTVSSDQLYTEELTIQTSLQRNLLRYSWNRETGEGQLSRTRLENTYGATLNLQTTEDGFRIQTSDLDALLAVLGEGEDKADTPATLTVSRGTDFATPAYKNLDSWSMEDILILLGGLGGLLGLNL